MLIVRKSSLGIALAALAMSGSIAASPALANSTPIITDYAGLANATSGAPAPGPATSSPLDGPQGVALDQAGNLYIADQSNEVIEKVTPDGTLSVIAGDGARGIPTAGPATSSALGDPEAVAVDSAGNVYIADQDNNYVEKVTPSGILSIFAGNGSAGISVAGPATSTPVSDPQGVAVDSAGNVYISEATPQVVKVTPSGTLSVVAGNGTSGITVPGPATSSPMGEPTGLAFDAAGDLYIVDDDDNVVDKVTPAGTLSVVAGDGTYGTPTAGPATSSELPGPWGIGVDSSGDIYVSDAGAPPDVEISPSGTLSISAGDGGLGIPNFGGPALSSPVGYSNGLAVNPDGTVFLSDWSNNTIDRVGLLTPGPPGQLVVTLGSGGTAQLSFLPPSDWGTSAVTSYQASLDGGSTWQTITTTPGEGGTLTASLSGLGNGTTYTVMVRAVNSSGPGDESLSGSITPGGAAPANSGVPEISGIAGVENILSCSSGSWSGAGRYGYQWDRDGAPIPGATAQSYAVTPADEGHTLTCTVTAYTSAGGSAQATSNGVLIPIFSVSLCPQPTGRLSGATLGPVSLGMSRVHARQKLARYGVRSHYSDNFCLAGGAGIRVGYATASLLGWHKDLKHGQIVLALTANPHYTLDGVKPGMRVASVARRLGLRAPIHLGPNWWYIIRGSTANGLLKVRHGVIHEIGIADRAPTATRPQQAKLLINF